MGRTSREKKEKHNSQLDKILHYQQRKEWNSAIKGALVP